MDNSLINYPSHFAHKDVKLEVRGAGGTGSNADIPTLPAVTEMLYVQRLAGQKTLSTDNGREENALSCLLRVTEVEMR